MNFSEIVSRITGISASVFGVSWNPPEAERAIARRVISFLEDRRVLYVPGEGESPEYCVRSVLDIRLFLTSELGNINRKAKIAAPLVAMRAACRKFLNILEADNGNIILHATSHMHYANFIFNSALGELRGVFGVHLAALASAHGLDIEDDLATILPGPPDVD